MTFEFSKCFLFAAMFGIAASSANASQPPLVAPDGSVIPEKSCGWGVTTSSERTAILARWIVVPTMLGLLSLGSAVLIRRRLRRITDDRWRRRCAALVGVLGAASLLLGLFVLMFGVLHVFDVISLYEPWN